MKILDEVNPTIAQIRTWGFDEDMYFMEQDEDLILHSSKYIPVLIELASDKNCPKQGYCEAILEYFTQLQLLFRIENEIQEIKESINNSEKLIQTEFLKNWKNNFDYLYDIFKSPQKLTLNQCEKIASDLNIGNYSKREITLIQTLENGALEFKVHYEAYQHFFYINPKTGNWKISKYDRIKDFT